MHARFPRYAAAITVAIVAIVVTLPARIATFAATDETEFLIDKHDMSRDHHEMAEFKRLLLAMDDALRKQAVERYMNLNQRLHVVMEREMAQAQEKAEKAGTADPRRVAIMRAGSGDSPMNPFADQDARIADASARAAKKRAEEMRKLIARAEELEFGLQQGESGAYTRNAAILDRFLKLLREDLAEVEKEIREKQNSAE